MLHSKGQQKLVDWCTLLSCFRQTILGLILQGLLKWRFNPSCTQLYSYSKLNHTPLDWLSYIPGLPLLSLTSIPLVHFPYWTTCTQALELDSAFGGTQISIINKRGGSVDAILGESHSAVRGKDPYPIFGVLRHDENLGHLVGSQLGGLSQVEDWIDLQVYGEALAYGRHGRHD